MVAVSFVDETKVVRRGNEFQNTVLPGTKPLPLTLSVKSPPVAGMEAGVSDVAVSNGFRFPSLTILLVNSRIAASEGSFVPVYRIAKPLVPQRTSCVPDAGE